MAARPPLANFGSKKSQSFLSRVAETTHLVQLHHVVVFSLDFRRRGVVDPAMELLPISRSGVGQWLGGGFLVFFFFFSKD
jgi:hypothetical protein